jgi:hypothetical protein
MLQKWEDCPVGNTPGTVSGLARRAPLSQVLVRAFAPIHTRRRQKELAEAA